MLYHGSKCLFSRIKRSQAKRAPAEKPLENLNAVYLTPEFYFALALAVRTNGKTRISHKDKTIWFEHPEEFDPDEEVFIYVVDLSHVPKESIVCVDERQIAVDLDEITPVKIEAHKAGEVLQYYKII